MHRRDLAPYFRQSVAHLEVNQYGSVVVTFAMLAVCLALLLVVRRLIVTMIVVVRAGRLRHLLDRSFRLDFHAKQVNLRAMIYSSDTTCFN